jgi:hypothetical protein
VATVAALTPSVVPKYDSPKYDRLRHCPPSVRILLEQARQRLLDAEYATRPVDRYAQAHLAALRATALSSAHALVGWAHLRGRDRATSTAAAARSAAR